MYDLRVECRSLWWAGSWTWHGILIAMMTRFRAKSETETFAWIENIHHERITQKRQKNVRHRRRGRLMMMMMMAPRALCHTRPKKLEHKSIHAYRWNYVFRWVSDSDFFNFCFGRFLGACFFIRVCVGCQKWWKNLRRKLQCRDCLNVGANLPSWCKVGARCWLTVLLRRRSREVSG